MIDEQTLMKFGFFKDKNNSWLKQVLQDGIKIKEIHIETYPNNPLIASSASYILLSRTIETNVIVSHKENNRLVLHKNDRYVTYLTNIPFDEIIECYYKNWNDCSEFILNIQNIYIRLFISN